MTADRVTMPFSFASRWASLLQHRADRRLMLEMDDHRLQDLGLRRGDLDHGDPLRRPVLPAHTEFCRRNVLVARGWTLKLYVPRADDKALRPEDHAVAGRALATNLAGPGTVCGFAIVRRLEQPGALRLSSWWWEGPCLSGTALDLPASTLPSRALEAGLDVRVIALIARGCAAWRRQVLDARRPDYAAYLVEDCS